MGLNSLASENLTRHRAIDKAAITCTAVASRVTCTATVAGPTDKASCVMRSYRIACLDRPTDKAWCGAGSGPAGRLVACWLLRPCAPLPAQPLRMLTTRHVGRRRLRGQWLPRGCGVSGSLAAGSGSVAATTEADLLLGLTLSWLQLPDA